MPRRKNIPAKVVDYDSLSDTYKALYDKIRAAFDKKNIYDLRADAAHMKIESPTTLGKNSLVKRLTDRVISDYLPNEVKHSAQPWDMFKDSMSGDVVKGMYECVDGECRMGRIIIPPLLANDYNLRDGDLIEGVVSQVGKNKMLVAINKVENNSECRRWFADVATCERRPFGDLIDGTKADELFGGLHMGERVIMKKMSIQDANEIARSFAHSVKLFIGLAPEYESQLESDSFVSSFDLTRAETHRVAHLALERGKRLAEIGQDVALVIKGFDFLDDRDMERALFGAGRCFDRGSLTVIAEMSKNKGDGVYAAIATRIV